MVAEAGSKETGIDEIRKALFPMAASFGAQVDKEMTIFTGSVHRDNGIASSTSSCRSSSTPGFREEDFRRLKDAQRNALVQDLVANNEEELGKERLQARLFAGTPYGHPALGTLAGIDAITLDDVKAFWKAAYTRAALTVGLAGDVPADLKARLLSRLGEPPGGPGPPGPGRREGARARRPSRSRSSRRRRAPRPSRSAFRSRSPARTPTSPPSPWPAPGSASTARRCRTSTSGSASCAA